MSVPQSPCACASYIITYKMLHNYTAAVTIAIDLQNRALTWVNIRSKCGQNVTNAVVLRGFLFRLPRAIYIFHSGLHGYKRFKIGVALTSCVGKGIGYRAAAARYWIISIVSTRTITFTLDSITKMGWFFPPATNVQSFVRKGLPNP